MPTDLISTKDIAERKGVNPTTVARWVKSGRLTPQLKLPGIRGAMFFSIEDVDALDADADESVAS